MLKLREAEHPQNTPSAGATVMSNSLDAPADNTIPAAEVTGGEEPMETADVDQVEATREELKESKVSVESTDNGYELTREAPSSPQKVLQETSPMSDVRDAPAAIIKSSLSDSPALKTPESTCAGEAEAASSIEKDINLLADKSSDDQDFNSSIPTNVDSAAAEEEQDVPADSQPDVGTATDPEPCTLHDTTVASAFSPQQTVAFASSPQQTNSPLATVKPDVHSPDQSHGLAREIDGNGIGNTSTSSEADPVSKSPQESCTPDEPGAMEESAPAPQAVVAEAEMPVKAAASMSLVPYDSPTSTSTASSDRGELVQDAGVNADDDRAATEDASAGGPEAEPTETNTGGTDVDMIDDNIKLTSSHGEEIAASPKEESRVEAGEKPAFPVTSTVTSTGMSPVEIACAGKEEPSAQASEDIRSADRLEHRQVCMCLKISSAFTRTCTHLAPWGLHFTYLSREQNCFLRSNIEGWQTWDNTRYRFCSQGSSVIINIFFRNEN